MRGHFALAMKGGVSTLLCTVLGLLVFSNAPAFALGEHELLRSFGSFNNIQGVAIDQATGDVYVYDAGAASIYRFNSAGEPEPFSGLEGSNAITEVFGAGNDENDSRLAQSALMQGISISPTEVAYIFTGLMVSLCRPVAQMTCSAQRKALLGVSPAA
jgi:hypothetical protein